jgi:abequosyltransferase
VSGIRLSICIPVYNFGAFIGATLDSIAPQVTNEVEVVVVDGASTDNTEEVVGSFQTRIPNLFYHRLDRKGGIDRDMAMSVELAKGKYCWLFGGDDILHAGAVPKMLAELDSGCDVYLCESLLCTKDMNPLMKHRMLDIDTERTFDLRDHLQRAEYFAAAMNTAAFFSFCSALVIRKSSWEQAVMNDAFYGTCWAHAARIFGMLPASLRIRYLPEPLLSKRGENDSFMDKGMVHRLGIAINGYNRIADDFFGHDTPEASHIRRVLRNECWIGGLAGVKIACAKAGKKQEQRTLEQLSDTIYGDAPVRTRLRFLVFRYLPPKLLLSVTSIRSSLRSVLIR